MENQTIPEKRHTAEWWKYYFLPMFFLMICILGLSFDVYLGSKEKEKAAKELSAEKLLNTTCSYKRDSLVKEVKQLSIYKSLTKAMVHRDEAASLLKYKVGDIVYSKRDSSQVVIDDIVIGGSKYEYYIRYRILHKDNSREEVIPELIY